MTDPRYEAALRDAGYTIERWAAGWVLLDPEGAPLLIGSHGCVAPRKGDAIAEGLNRIEQEAA